MKWNEARKAGHGEVIHRERRAVNPNGFILTYCGVKRTRVLWSVEAGRPDLVTCKRCKNR